MAEFGEINFRKGNKQITREQAAEELDFKSSILWVTVDGVPLRPILLFFSEIKMVVWIAPSGDGRWDLYIKTHHTESNDGGWTTDIVKPLFKRFGIHLGMDAIAVDDVPQNTIKCIPSKHGSGDSVGDIVPFVKMKDEGWISDEALGLIKAMYEFRYKYSVAAFRSSDFFGDRKSVMWFEAKRRNIPIEPILTNAWDDIEFISFDKEENIDRGGRVKYIG